jgi:hypothetical protein
MEGTEMRLSEQSIARLVAFNLDSLMNRTTGCPPDFVKVILNLGVKLTPKTHTLRAEGRGCYVEWFFNSTTRKYVAISGLLNQMVWVDDYDHDGMICLFNQMFGIDS